MSSEQPPETPSRSREQRTLIYVIGGAVAAIVIVTVVVWFATRGSSVVADDTGAPSAASLDEVQKYDDVAADHVTTEVTYEQSPPVGGPHNPLWLNCGVYSAEVPSENAVHSLEHGAVWITYQPDADPAEVQALEDIMPETFAVLSPYSEQSAPIVVSAWGRQLSLDEASDPRLDEFIREFRLGGIAPEPGASCDGASDGTVPLDAVGS